MMTGEARVGVGCPTNGARTGWPVETFTSTLNVLSAVLHSRPRMPWSGNLDLDDTCVLCGGPLRKGSVLVCPACADREESAGKKHDAGKPRWDLYLWDAAEAEVRVLMHGASKYGSDDNWRLVPDARRRYFAAALRHLLAWWGGEEKDAETGESHLAHLRCCAGFLMELTKGG